MRPVHLVYVSAGGGHRAAARAVQEELDARKIPNVMMDLLDFSSDLFKWSYSDVYAFVSEHAHIACKVMYELTDQDREESAVLRLLEKINMENVKKFMRYLTENQPDVCVGTHFFPLSVLSHMKEQGLYRGKIYGIVTDYGLHRMWISQFVDSYFVGGASVKEDLLQAGIPEHKIIMSGIPVMKRYGELYHRDRQFYKSNEFSILFVASSVPNSLVLDILEGVIESGMSLSLSVVAGRNEDLIEQLERITIPSRVKFQLLGFVENLYDYMAEADVMITKPGGLTVSEAFCAGAPLLMINPIPKQEINNAKYIESHNAGIWARSASEAIHHLRDLYSSPEKLQIIRANARKLAFPHAAKAVADAVLSALNI
ncbi:MULTISPECIES: MGDG synthase family glycosyltransferase [Aminobacterium]|uniref:MGDG synthase family glycosyltransferase n=1 Tax=Aminobacterium TaxID=81466 RepID=UPI00046437CA|nr:MULTISPECIES: glycosyltransferase [Aminobacterium]